MIILVKGTPQTGLRGNTDVSCLEQKSI